MRKSIGLKILSVALVMVALMAVVTSISSWHLDAVSDEAQELAHYYIPIQQHAHLAARYSTSELLHLERYIALKHAGAPPERLKAEQDEMERYARLVDVMIVQSLAKVDEGDKDTEINISSPMYEQLRIELPQISTAHGQMAKTVEQYLKESDSGDPKQALVYEALLTTQRQDVAKEIDDVTVLLDKLTEDSSQSALALEDKARKFTWAVTGGAALIGLVLAAADHPRAGAAGAGAGGRDVAVQGGNLNVNLRVQSTDEIGSLTRLLQPHDLRPEAVGDEPEHLRQIRRPAHRQEPDRKRWLRPAGRKARDDGVFLRHQGLHQHLRKTAAR